MLATQQPSPAKYCFCEEYSHFFLRHAVIPLLVQLDSCLRKMCVCFVLEKKAPSFLYTRSQATNSWCTYLCKPFPPTMIEKKCHKSQLQKKWGKGNCTQTRGIMTTCGGMCVDPKGQINKLRNKIEKKMGRQHAKKNAKSVQWLNWWNVPQIMTSLDSL